MKDRDIDPDPKNFWGVQLTDIPDFAKCFDVNVNIYQLRNDDVDLHIFKSICRFKDTLHLKLFENHLSYINNLPGYNRQYECATCDRHFPRLSNMKRHQKIYKGQTKYRFPGGFYSTPKTIFDQLEQHGIAVPEEDRGFEWFLVYDFEAILQKSREPSSDKLKWTHQHILISVSSCSNVIDYTELRCIIDSEVDSLIRQIVDYMTQIGHKFYQLALDKFAFVFEALDNDFQHVDVPLDLDVVIEDEEWLQERKKMQDHLEELKKELDEYCLQLICLGFNSAKYDLNLVKTHIVKHLNMHDGQKVFTIKRNNQYACLSNECFKILDVTQYLAARTNYDSFLKAYDASLSKGFFPYEWLDDVSKLEYQSLPPHESFYSSLKQTNISLQEYEFCQHVWVERRMRTFKDFLE